VAPRRRFGICGSRGDRYAGFGGLWVGALQLIATRGPGLSRQALSRDLEGSRNVAAASARELLAWLEAEGLISGDARVDLTAEGEASVLFYRAALPLSRKTLNYVAGIIRRRRASIGSCWRKLNPGQQTLLVLAYLRKGDTFAELAAGFGVGTTTAWRYSPGCKEGRARLRGRGRDHHPH